MSTVKSNADHLTLNADGASKDIKFQANGVEKASISSTGAMTATSYAGDGSALTNLPSSGGGKVKQIVNVQDGSMATGTTVIPRDDTIPQITEGDEYMTLAITPTSATSKLEIKVVVHYASSASANYMTTLLFVGTTTNALAASLDRQINSTNSTGVTSFIHHMTAGATTELTFRVRAGGFTAGTTTFNGRNATGYYGGTIPSSITITEYEV